MLRGWVFRKRLSRKCSHFIRQVIYWWIHNSMASLGDDENLKGVGHGGKILGVKYCPWPLPLQLFLLLWFFFAIRWAAFLCYILLPWHFAHEPWRLGSQQWNLWNCDSNVSFPPLRYFSQVFSHSDKGVEIICSKFLSLQCSVQS